MSLVLTGVDQGFPAGQGVMILVTFANTLNAASKRVSHRSRLPAKGRTILHPYLLRCRGLRDPPDWAGRGVKTSDHCLKICLSKDGNLKKHTWEII